MEGMWHNFKKLINRKKGQFELPFKFDDNGHTIEQTTLSEENKNSKKY